MHLHAVTLRDVFFFHIWARQVADLQLRCLNINGAIAEIKKKKKVWKTERKAVLLLKS